MAGKRRCTIQSFICCQMRNWCGEQTACLERLYDYNQTRPGEMESACHAKGDVCIEFRVSSTFGHSRSVSDKPQTMSGLSGVPNGTSS